MTPKLTIAIATMGDRASGIHLPLTDPQITYIVVIQRPREALPPALVRPDVEVIESDQIGLSNSRNVALDAARTEFMLLADDDLGYCLDGILSMLSTFARTPETAIMTGRLAHDDGTPMKKYPETRSPWVKSNCGRIGSPEIMIRLSAIRGRGIRFDPRFGLGSNLPSGEEFIFVIDAISAGLQAEFLPLTLATHPPISTGNNWNDPRLMNARMAVLKRAYGAASPLIRVAYSIRKRKLMGSWKSTIRFALGIPFPPN